MMRSAVYRRGSQRPRSRSGRRWWRWGAGIAGACLGLFVIANVIMGVLYRNKVLPGYYIGGVPVENIAFDELDKRVPITKIMPEQVVLQKETTREIRAPTDLGITIDWPDTRRLLRQEARSWLPLLSLFARRSVPAQLTIHQTVFAAAAAELEGPFTKQPLPERITLDGERFVIAAAQVGYRLDAAALEAQLMSILQKGGRQLAVPTRPLEPPPAGGNLNAELAKLQKQLEASITLVSGAQTKKLSRAEISRFYEPSGQTLQLSAARTQDVLGDTVKAWGITPANQHDAVNAVFHALTKNQAITFKYAAPGDKIRRYCIAARGLNQSVLTDYKYKLAAVYADPRGWEQGGAALVYVDSGCDFTAWLSAPESMTSFGGVCDSYYSCRSGRNVVVNYDRWMGATDPWNAAGGTLEDYRVMVINHETGHWLSFGHRNCTAPGDPAPVMQQQSISLQGCKFNPWPTPAEIATLKQSLGL